MTRDEHLYSRYLGILGGEIERADLEGLSRLVRAQLFAAPFENISKLVDRTRGRFEIRALEEYLDGIESLGLGGTCYANAIHFWGLLCHLGFEARLCGAAMSRPDVHAVVMVRCDGREYLVDVGYGAPLDHPLPRDLHTAYEVSLGNETYRLHPQDQMRRSRMDHLREGERIHGYIVSPRALEPSHFDEEIRRSFEDDSTFMGLLHAVRFSQGRSISLTNRALIESAGSTTRKTSLADQDEVVATLVSRFSMPERLAREAVDQVQLDKEPDLGG